MKNNWQTVYSTKILYKSEMVKDILNENHIESVILNKMDSSYLNFGSIEVKVQADKVIQAKYILSKLDLD